MSTPDLESARVVEIGHHDVFRLARPDRSFLLWTGRVAKAPAENWADFGWGEFNRLRQRIAHGEVDLIVAYADDRAPWHWRKLHDAMRRPWQPIRKFVRSFGVPLVRFLPRDVPLVVVDYSDSQAIARHNHFLLDRCRYYFKRELPVDRWQVFERTGYGGLPSTRFRHRPSNRRRVEKLRPVALGCPVESIPPAEMPFPEKTSDVFAALSLPDSSTVRLAGVEELRALQAEGVRVDMTTERIPQDEFYKRMAESWLTWSPEGFGWECFRHYEAPMQLSVPVINAPKIARQNPLRDGEHALYYRPDEPGDLARTIRSALADKGRLRCMAEAARRHVHAHHLWPWRQAEALLRYGLGLEDAPGGLKLD